MKDRIEPVPHPAPRLRLAAIAVAVLAGLALSVPATASAHQKKWDVFFGGNGARSDGGTSEIRGIIFVEVALHPKEACVPHRRIRLYEVRAGADRLLGSRRTTRAGAYRFTFPGEYWGRRFALKLLPKVIRRDGRHLHVCEAQTVPLHYPTPAPPVPPPEPEPPPAPVPPPEPEPPPEL
jgi:hypothetical protein